MPSDKAEPYGLSKDFERATVYLCASSPEFYGRIGQEIDPDCLGQKPAQHAMEAIRALATEQGHGPSKPLLVIQHLARLRREGKRTVADVAAVDEMFNAAVDTGLPEEEEAVQQLVQILRRRIHQEIVGDVSKTFARRGDFTPIARRIEAAEDLGSTDTTLGTVLGTASFSEIEELRNLVRLGFGIPEVDSEIGGGVPKGTLTTLIGEEKGGKSMSLVQVSAEALLKEHNVYFATLELPRVFQLIRLKANLTGVPIDSIINGSLPVAKERVRQLIEGEDGRLEVKEFSAGTTTPRDIFRWVKASEAHSGNRCSVLVIDYADLLSAGKDLKSYEAGKKVYIELRAFARAHDCWVFTASQAQRKTKDRKRIKLEHVADSMHKVRIADLIISLNKADDDTDSLVWHIAGGRYCPTGAETPPLPHDFECGRVGPVNRQVPWEA